MRQFSFASVLSVLVLCSTFVGCGGGPTYDLGSPVDISGKITMDGKPAAGVDVIFKRQGGGAPPESSSFAAKTDANGAYSISGVYLATYSVMVVEPEPEGGTGEQEEGAAALDEGPYAKYGMNSQLTATVAEGKTTFDFELNSEPAPATE